MRSRQPHGSFIAENTAVIVVLLLALTFPLINMATSAYRYNMVCGAAKAGAHAGATASTFLAATSVGPAASASIPAVVHNYLDSAQGVSHVAIQYRINQAKISDQTVTNNPWQTPLAQPADPDNYMYTVEVVVDADVSPIVTMAISNIVPNVPGVTGPSHQTVSAQEVVETISGLNQ
jgi:hypothetical protein